MYQHLFFDLDDTVTRSRSLIESTMRAALTEVMERGNTVAIVSGAKVEQARKQMDNLPCYYLGQNGNHAYDGKAGKDIWRHELSQKERDDIMNHIHSIPRTWSVSDENDLIQDRGCQISYSLLGHNEVLEKKEAFDPDFSKRKQLLQRYPLVSDTIEVKIGGTTCLDYMPKGKHKGYNVAMFIEKLGWEKSKCIYVGDALFPGGNDDTLLGVIETRPVENPTDTLAFLKQILSSGR